MKKIYKIMVFVLMLALAVGSAAIAPITSVFAISTALVGASIVLAKMPSTGKVNQQVKIPKGTVGAQTTLDVVVKDPYGIELSSSELTEEGDFYVFTPAKKGTYTVEYTAEKEGGSKKVTKVFTIKVTGATATIDFEENTPFILQSKVGENSKLVLPVPTIKIDEEEVENPTYVIKVTDPKHNVWTKDTQINDLTNPISTHTIDGKAYTTFQPTKDDGETVFGTYTIEYQYTNAETGLVRKTQTVQVSKNYSVANQKVTFTWNGTMPESAVLGNEVELPKPVTVDANSNSASVKTYTDVKVVYHNGDQTTDVDVEDFKFTPEFVAKSGTYYEIVYKIYTLEQLNLTQYATIEDALEAAEATALKRTYTLKNVTDTVSPVPQVVANYAVEENGTLLDATIEALDGEDVSYLIPSKARTQVEVKIPAIYATDNFNEYKDLTLKRSLLDEDNNELSLDGNSTLNEDETSLSTKVVQAKVNEEATVLFRAKGTYTVRYRATDKAGNIKDATFKIVVSDNFTDTVSPTITLPTIQASTKPGETVSFKEATVVDYATSAEEVATNDSNIKKDVYYFFGEVDAAIDLTDDAAVKTYFDAKIADANTFVVNKDEKDSSKYSFEIPENVEANFVTVVFRAEDDAKYAVGNTDNNVAYKFKTIAIYGSNDNVAPVLITDLQDAVNTLQMADYGQNEVVNLGTYEFTDEDGTTDTTKFLTTNLKVYDKNGTEVKVSGVKYVYDGTKFVVKDGKFLTTFAGTYQVVITTTDLGGNTLIHSMQFDVRDTKAPVVEVGTVETTMELGKTYTLQAPVVVDDGEVIENQATNRVEFGEDNPSYEYNEGTMEFTPLEKGTYTFRFVGKDGLNEEVYSDYYTVEVKDTIDPVITLDETQDYKINATAEYKDSNNEVVTVKLPLFTAEDEYNGIKTTSVKATDPDGDELEVTLADDKTHYEFTPNKNGVFTVTYNAVDFAGNSTTKTYTIKVGDVTPAAITVGDKNIPTSYKVGQTLTIDLTAITTTDDVDGTLTGKNAVKDNAKTKLDITMTDNNGSSVTFTKEDEIWSYEFTSAGKYTLTFKTTDSAGNTDDLVYNFEVSATTNSTTSAETAWGIALTVVAVLLLAGVVVYFVKTKDAPDAKPTKKDEE